MYSLKSWMVVHLFLLLFPQFSYSLDPLLSFNSSVNLHQSWSSTPSHSTWFYDSGYIFLPILLSSTESASFVFGYFAKAGPDNTKDGFYLAIVFLQVALSPRNLVVVWCANRDKPVRDNATLNFTTKGGLELENGDGTLVWSTNTFGFSVARLNISSGGNLMLLDRKDNVIWQSFDYPTDSWLPNQNISSHKGLTSSNLSSVFSTGSYSLTMGPNNSLVAFINSDPRQNYMSLLLNGYTDDFCDNDCSIEALSNYALLKVNRTLRNFLYLKLEPTGHLILKKLPNYDAPNITVQYDLGLYTMGNSDCGYPMTCGNYGVCSGYDDCSCPGGNTSYFTQSQAWQPNLRCTTVTPLSCKDKHLHSFLELKNVTYFKLESNFTMDIESCKKACLDNCTCKAAFFSSGQCSLKSQLYSLKYDVTYNSVAFIKVQNQSLPLTKRKLDKKKSYLIPILASTLSVGLVIILVVVASCYYKMLIRLDRNNEEEGDDQITGALRRFSFLELKSATRDFQVRLGRGGFGSVFEGDLADGSKVAVKCLDSVGQGRKEFLAEVNTIGNINHFNLVRLIGYCAEKSNRLLVYEYMCNGSLDKWIFNPDRTQALGWEIRRKIIIDLAKGLEYLHILCNPSIIHFDIKPQNILLDGDFNVKISDFGLAKLIDRDQSQVLTVMKGTPGYLAPELFYGTNISVKADVFSFGIVVLEIVLRRKNLESTQSEPLIELVKDKAEKDQLQDLVDEYNEDVESSNKEEAMKMTKIGIWCLQAHRTRPSISTILKVLEGSMNLGSVAEFCFEIAPPIGAHVETTSTLSTNSTLPVASILSGPR